MLVREHNAADGILISAQRSSSVADHTN